MKDYFGKSADSIKTKKLFLFDLDGTIYKEGILFEGALELLHKINEIGGIYVFITNNSSMSVYDYVNKINKLGIKVNENNFFTSTQATAVLLQEKYAGIKVYCQGTKAFIDELRGNGVCVTEEVEDDIGVVMVGFDTELTSEKLRKTCMILGREIDYYATNCDLRCPVSFGYIPDCGSICEMIKNCTGKEPIYIGKPETTMVDLVMKKFSIEKEETVVIGDRLYTDIAMGNNAGITSICVLTGEATASDIELGTIKPTLTFRSVKDICENI